MDPRVVHALPHWPRRRLRCGLGREPTRRLRDRCAAAATASAAARRSSAAAAGATGATRRTAAAADSATRTAAAASATARAGRAAARASHATARTGRAATRASARPAAGRRVLTGAASGSRVFTPGAVLAEIFRRARQRQSADQPKSPHAHNATTPGLAPQRTREWLTSRPGPRMPAHHEATTSAHMARGPPGLGLRPRPRGGAPARSACLACACGFRRR